MPSLSLVKLIYSSANIKLETLRVLSAWDLNLVVKIYLRSFDFFFNIDFLES